MSIHFSQIHNLVRTYQHVLNLDAKNPPAKPTASEAAKEDRVTVSAEAREMQQHQPPPAGSAKETQNELV